MKTHLCVGASILALASFPSLAADPSTAGGGYPMYQPSISVGYVYDGHTDLTYKNPTPGAPFGLSKLTKKIQNDSAWYVGLDLPVKINDRFEFAVGGRWDVSSSDKDSVDIINNDVARRKWETDSRKWNNAHVSLSYAFYRNPSVSLSAMAGLRWDRQTASFSKPVLTKGFVVSSVTDKSDFNMTNFSPVIGIDAVFAGPRSGMWGGPIKLSLSGSPFVKSNVDHDVNFGPFLFKHDADSSNGKFIKIAGDVTVLSFKAGTAGNGALSIFADYSRFEMNGSAKSWSTNTVTPRVDKWDYNTRASESTVGVKASLAF